MPAVPSHQVRLWQGYRLQEHHRKRGHRFGRLHGLRTGSARNSARTVWPRECAVQFAFVRRLLGCCFFPDQRVLELHALPGSHWLCWSHLRDKPVLVFNDVCAERGRNGERDSSRLGQPRRRRDADLYHVVLGDPDALGRNR